MRSEMLDRILRDYEAVAARLPDAAVSRAARASRAAELTRWAGQRPRRAVALRQSARLRARGGISPAACWRRRRELATAAALANCRRPCPALSGWSTSTACAYARAVTRGRTCRSRPAAPGRAGRRSSASGCCATCSPATLRRCASTAAAAIEVLFLTSAAAAGAACYPRLQLAARAGQRAEAGRAPPRRPADARPWCAPTLPSSSAAAHS